MVQTRSRGVQLSQNVKIIKKKISTGSERRGQLCPALLKVPFSPLMCCYTDEEDAISTVWLKIKN